RRPALPGGSSTVSGSGPDQSAAGGFDPRPGHAAGGLSFPGDGGPVAGFTVAGQPYRGTGLDNPAGPAPDHWGHWQNAALGGGVLSRGCRGAQQPALLRQPLK